MAIQYSSGEMWDDWYTLKPNEVCTPEELCVKAEQLVGLKQELEKLKATLLEAYLVARSMCPHPFHPEASSASSRHMFRPIFLVISFI